MYLLAIETSSAQGSVALYEGDSSVEEVLFTAGLVHGREVTSRVQDLLSRHGIGPGGLDAIGVSIGPGSYTGIRVGVTAAKTLAFALGIRVVAVSSLEAIAGGVHRDRDGDIAVLVDGKQGHLYRALFRSNGEALRRMSPDGLLDLGLVEESGWREIPPRAVLVGDGTEAFLQRVPAAAGSFCRTDRGLDSPRASVVGQLAVSGVLCSDALDGRTKVHKLVPIYLRPSEAERRRGLSPAAKEEGTNA